jgi:hypothetical protein
MVITEDGSILVSDGYGNARIHKYSLEGDIVQSWGEPGSAPGQFMVPHNLGLDGDRIGVADRETHCVRSSALMARSSPCGTTSTPYAPSRSGLTATCTLAS